MYRLRPTCLARRRGRLALAARVGTPGLLALRALGAGALLGGRVVAPFFLLAAQAFCRGAEPAADPLGLGLLLGTVGLRRLGVRVVLAAHELDLRDLRAVAAAIDRKSTRLNSSHSQI